MRAFKSMNGKKEKKEEKERGGRRMVAFMIQLHDRAKPSKPPVDQNQSQIGMLTAHRRTQKNIKCCRRVLNI